MSRPSLLAAVLLGTAFLPLHPARAQQAPGPQAFQGVWTGTLDAGAAKLRLVFHVRAAEGGTLAGTMDSPDQGAAGIQASSVTVEGSTDVDFVVMLAGPGLPGDEMLYLRAATARMVPGLNHLFQTATTGSPSEYATITETMSPVALQAVSSWIKERFHS